MKGEATTSLTQGDSAWTNSLRVVMLICLVTLFCPRPDNPTGSKLREATGQHE